MKNSKNTWNDFLFENRNKLYGAYAIRVGQSRNLLKSLLISCSILLLIILGLSFTVKETVIEPYPDIDPVIFEVSKIDDFQEIKKPEILITALQNRPKAEKVDSDIIPNPVPNPEIEQPLNTQENMGAIESDEEEGEGEFIGSVVYGTDDGSEDGETDEEVVEKVKEVYTVREVSKLAVFPGCESVGGSKQALMSCMSSKLHKELGAELRDFGEIAHKYNIDVAKAKVQFVVDVSGRITHIQVLNGTNPHFNSEAEKALKQIANRYEKRNKFLQAAELDDGTKVNMNYVIPLNYLMR